MKRKHKKVETRTDAVEQTRLSLIRRGWPRLQMSLILVLTICAGFLLSNFLLDAGLRWMWLRYPLMILFAYSVFLLLLGAWVQLQRMGGLDMEIHDADLDLSDAVYYYQTSGGSGRSWFSGGRSWSSGGSRLFDGFDLDFDADDGCAVLLAVIALLAAVVGALVVSFYVIYAAPALLAEILVDSLLLAGLYKRLKHVERKHWLKTAFGKTWLPLVSVLLLFTLAGYLIQRAVPEAHSIGDFWQHITRDDAEPPPA
jgi:hypothetical protein